MARRVHKMPPMLARKFMRGPGGSGCPCCTFGHPSSWKAQARRAARRAAKLTLKLEMEQ